MDTISQLVGELASIRAKQAPLNEALKPLKEFETEVKHDLMVAMQDASNRRTDPVNGYYALRKVTTKYQVVDAPALVRWLEANGEDVESYYTLDTKKVEAKCEAIIQETGEIIPGTLAVNSEHVSLQEDKGK